MGRYLFFDKNDEIIDEGKYFVWWQRINEPENKYPWNIKTDMFSSSIIQNDKLDVDKDKMVNWAQAFLKCYSEFDGVECRNIVHDDILIKDKVKDEEYDKDMFIQYINIKYYVKEKKITDYKIEKIAQNKLKIMFDGNFEIDAAKTKVSGEIIAWFDMVT